MSLLRTEPFAAQFLDGGGALFNVKHPSYGATGDGTTDDTAAIQAAIDDAGADGGGLVLCPRPTSKYMFSNLEIPAGVQLIGSYANSAMTYYTNLEQISGASGSAIAIVGTALSRVTGSALKRLSISKAGSVANTGIDLQYTSFTPIEDVQMFGFDVGLGLTAVWDSGFYNVFSRNVNYGCNVLAGGTSASTDTCNDLKFYGLNLETWAIAGLRVIGNGAANNNQLFFYGLKVEGQPGASATGGIILSDVRTMTVKGATCVIKAGSTPPAGYPMISLNGDAIGVVLEDIMMDNQGVTVGSFLENTSGNNSDIRANLLITNTTSAATNGLVHNASGTASDWKVDISHVFDPTGSTVQVGTFTRAAVNYLGRPAGAVHSPSALASGSNNDYALADAHTMRLTADAGGSTITGLAGGYYGRRVRIVKIGGGTFKLAHNSGSSSAGNKIFSGSGADVTVVTDGVADLEYDTGSAVWRVCNLCP